MDDVMRALEEAIARAKAKYPPVPSPSPMTDEEARRLFDE